MLKKYDTLPEFDLSVLTEVWQRIYQEFSDIAGGNRADLWLVKTKRLIIMKLQYQHHSSLLRACQSMRNQELINLARDEGYMIELDNFQKTFEKAYTRLMRMKNQINIFEKEQEVDENTDEPGLDNLIITLSRFQGYQFNEKKMSVKQFANIYKDYKNAQAA